MSQVVISLQDVWKVYQMGDVQVEALRGLSLNIKKGEFLAIMGASGSGKCVAGDTQILLGNGCPVKIKDLEGKDVEVLALGKDNKIGKFKVSKFYKRKVRNFLKVKTSSGRVIKVTDEHPFFTLGDGGIKQINAGDLKKGIFITAPRKLNLNGCRQHLNPFNHMSNDDGLVISDSPELFSGVMSDLGINRKGLSDKFNINYSTCDSWFYHNNVRLKTFRKILSAHGKEIRDYENNIKLTPISSNNAVNVPAYTSPQLLELYGFIVGDGNLDKDGIKVTNIDKKLKQRIRFLFKEIFDFEVKSFIDKRLDANNKVLKSFFINVFEFPEIKKSRNVSLPSFVFDCSNEELAAFIKGLFDCDCYVAKDKKEINITLASEILINQLSYLFLRFGIHSRLSEKIKCAMNTEKRIKRKYYSLSISGFENIKKYDELIGFNSEFKNERVKKHLSGGRNTNVDVIPCGAIIKRLVKESGVVLDSKLNKSLRGVVNGYYNPSVNKVKEVIKLFENKGISCDELKSLVNCDIFWDKVISVEKESKEMEVYDLTVPGADNFIANQMIIHNSTAMNMIGCLDVPTRGKIFLNNHNIAHLDESHLASIRGRTIGFIFQQFNLIPTLTALENVMLPMIFQGVPRDKRISKATELLNAVGLGDRINHRPSELSGGQQQRVAIARALCNDPDVILADEPTGNLDSKTGKEILSLLADLHEKHGKTVIMVTHDQNVASCADRVELLTDGHIIADGKSVLRKLRGVKNE